MAFIVADGTNSETANSYVSLEYANSYHGVRDNSAWASASGDAAKQAALIKATDYVEQMYSQRWIGAYPGDGIGLSWPRNLAAPYGEATIPDNLKKAVCELALDALSTELNATQIRDTSVKFEKADVVETEYFEKSKGVLTMRPKVAGYLQSLIGGSVYNRTVVRV